MVAWFGQLARHPGRRSATVFGNVSTQLRALVETDGVIVHPGYFFDFPRESYLVVSLLPPEPVFADGVDRILRRVTTASSGHA